MTEETSLIDYITNITLADQYIVIPSVFGALVMMGWWYYKEFDRKAYFQLDERKKQFRLGYMNTVLSGFAGGSILALLVRSRFGIDLDSAGVLSFLGGALVPWTLIKAGHWQWQLVVQGAKHPLFASVTHQQQKALTYAGDRSLSAVDKKIMSATGSTTTPIDESGLKDWEQRRDLALARMLGWWQRQKKFPPQYQCIPDSELEEVHSIIPQVNSVRGLMQQVQGLEGQQSDLTLSQKLGYERMIMSQSQLMDQYQGTIEEYQEALEKQHRSQDPQYQVTKQIIYGFFGFLFRQLLIWVGV